MLIFLVVKITHLFQYIIQSQPDRVRIISLINGDRFKEASKVFRMIAKQKIKILIGVIIVIATYHFIVSSNVRSKDLSDLVDLGSLDKSTTENERPKNNIVTNNRLDNPPNEDIPHAEPDSPPQEPPKSGNKADFSIFFEGLEKFAIKQPGIKDKYTSEKAKEKFSTDDNFLFGKEYLENVLISHKQLSKS